MHDIISNIKIEQVLSPQTIQASALNSGNIDCAGVETVAIAVLVGNITDTLDASNRIDLKIEHADDNGSGAPGSYAACTDADVQNASDLTDGIFASVNDSDLEQTRHIIGYAGGKRFVKVTATPVSLETGGAIAMIALKGNAAQKPVDNA
jgi:hypothetical protein